MNEPRLGEPVYIYSMEETGRVVERTGVVSFKSRKNQTLVATLPTGQKLILNFCSGKIRNDSMWSRSPQKNVYIEKMLDILVERRDAFQNKARLTTSRIANIRACASG